MEYCRAIKKEKIYMKRIPIAGPYQWLTPVILATWEAEIRRIMVQGQTRQIVLTTLSPK
jgi:hypothetical protein